jgi:ArsR family transcriptional regulator
MSISPKQALFAEFASVARAIGHPHRLEILEHLAQGERGVDALSSRLGLSIANASQHLQQMRRAALRGGRQVRVYRLATLRLYYYIPRQVERNIAEVTALCATLPNG